jgi:hypothetical protein
VSTIGTALGFAVFLLMLLTAVQVLFNLYATSVVTAAAHDAAREVAGFRSAGARCAAAVDAEQGFHHDLGDYGRQGRASLEWDCLDPSVVTVRVQATHPSVLPARLRGLLDLGHLDRTIEVRIEDER